VQLSFLEALPQTTEACMLELHAEVKLLHCFICLGKLTPAVMLTHFGFLKVCTGGVQGFIVLLQLMLERLHVARCLSVVLHQIFKD